MKVALGVLLTAACFAGPYDLFEPYQKTLSRDYVSDKISRYLDSSEELRNYYEIEEDALVLYTSLEAKEVGRYEYRLEFGEGEPQRGAAKPLRVAIDPGHIGGDWAQLEERFIDFNYRGKRIQFDEGTLTLLTALLLREKLVKEGIEVFLTRDSTEKGAYPEQFFDWLKYHPEHWKKGATLSGIFRRYYNRLDMRERARQINAFNPDLTVCIHYNALEELVPTEQNYNLVFIPGSFGKGELSEVEDRTHFLRLVCTPDLDRSKEVAKKLVQSFSKHTKVPPFENPFPNSRMASTGVYCRNLCLTRLIEGPVCYGETLIQNHKEELLRLSQMDHEVQGMACPKRVVEVAEAYFETIIGELK